MSKLNLNRLVKRPATEYDIESLNMSMVESFKHLFELLEIDPNLVDCIVDWLDENDQEQPFGAESSHYESLDPPMKCKDGPMDSVEELLLVKGFDKKILYGDDKKPGLAEFVTVFGDEGGLVNINTAPEEVVAALLNSESLASTIVDMRQTSHFESAQDMAARLPDINLSEKFTTRSSYFLAVSSGRILSDESQTHAPPTRDVKIRALLRRVHADEQQLDHEYFSIDTAFWKVER
jgi:type II secretory pathway component PulK